MTPLDPVRVLIKGVDDLFAEIHDGLDVFHRFIRKTQHEVQFNGGLTAGERESTSAEYLLL